MVQHLGYKELVKLPWRRVGLFLNAEGQHWIVQRLKPRP